MPQKGVSKKTDRQCLICNAHTRVAHLGIDACRACSVFYRRAEKGNNFTCRTSTRQCEIGQGLDCKRCRFDHIARLLKRVALPSDVAHRLGPSHAAAASADTDDQPSSWSSGDCQNTAAPSTEFTYSSSSAFASVAPPVASRVEFPLLERLKTAYRTMSWARLNVELHSRANPPHPISFNLKTGPFFPATFVAMNVANRVLLTSMIDFGGCVFPEFAELTDRERWDIVLNVFYRFRIFEGCYRANHVFPDNIDTTFATYSAYVNEETMEHFFSDAKSGDVAAAMAHMKKGSGPKLSEVRTGRQRIMRVNPTEEEFLVVVALMFWSIEDMPVGDKITQLGERYREIAMRELHAFYKERLKLDDYAIRLGELLSFLQAFERTKDIKEHFEMLRLLDVLPEDSFTYRLQKE